MTRVTRASLDGMLKDALRPDATAAPVPDGLLRVPDRWVRGGRLTGSGSTAVAVLGVMTLAAATTLVVLTVVGGLQERAPFIGSDDVGADVGVPIEALDLESRPGQVPELGQPAIGPVMEVARGRVEGSEFRYTVYRGADPSDVCIQFEWVLHAGACGALPGEGPTGGAFGVGSMTHDSAVVHEVFGLAAPNVAEVWIQTDAGQMARTHLVPTSAADVDALLFFTFLPEGVASSAWIALDAAGNEIDRLETPPGPPAPSAPVPTPGQPPAP